MLSYKDITFCKYYKTCKDGKMCLRALTENIKETAKSLELLICEFSEKPDCHKDKKK